MAGLSTRMCYGFPSRYLPPDLKGLYKHRFGDYRILVWVNREARVLTLYGVGHRSDIYRKLR
jgi:mRNA-degrading endonuclease RelE of RelBE toxin-antitoxin system